MIMITSPGSIVNRFNSALIAYQYLFTGSFGNLQSLSYTLVNTSALIFTGLSVAIAYRAGLFNIGAAGQLTVGTVVSGLIALLLPTASAWLLIPLMIIGGALAGAIWGGIVGLLKAWRGAHEVVTTIMLNWIAFDGAATLINGPFQGPGLSQQTVPMPAQTHLPMLATLYNQTLGALFGQIPFATQYTLDISFLFALLALVVYWFITARTTFGYELRVIGQNVKAARYAGIPVKRNIMLAMALAGMFAALGGSFRLMGQAPYQLVSAYSTDSTGFNAIGVALLGRTTGIGMLLSGLLFGGLTQAGPYMQLLAHVPGDLVYIMQALVLFTISIEFLPVIQRMLPQALGKKQPLTPNITGQTTTVESEEEESMVATAGTSVATSVITQDESNPEATTAVSEQEE
jgi:simple sugar transport system permease protein